MMGQVDSIKLHTVYYSENIELVGSWHDIRLCQKLPCCSVFSHHDETKANVVTRWCKYNITHSPKEEQ